MSEIYIKTLAKSIDGFYVQIDNKNCFLISHDSKISTGLAKKFLNEIENSQKASCTSKQRKTSWMKKAMKDAVLRIWEAEENGVNAYYYAIVGRDFTIEFPRSTNGKVPEDLLLFK